MSPLCRPFAASGGAAMLARMANPTRSRTTPAPAGKAGAAKKPTRKRKPAPPPADEALAEAEAPKKKAASTRKAATAKASKAKSKRASASKATPRKASATREAKTQEVPALPARPRTAAQREAAFDALVRAACLKAGTAAAISSLTRRVPVIGRLAPTILGPLAETVALAQVQKTLVREIIALYEVELTDPEERGVILLATAANIGAQQLSKRSMEALLKQFGTGFVGEIAARVLPLASVLAEVTAAVASTYTIAKRAQALCRLPGTGAGNLADLLRGLSGIDQNRLLKWSGEAFRLALAPFRGVLGLVWR